MPIDLSLLAKIAEGITKLIESALKIDEEKRARFRGALKVILAATLDTKHYLSSQRDGVVHDSKEEARLSNLWKDASVEIREFDRDLSNLCMHEANYWADPPLWNFREINQAKRILQVIADRIKRIRDKQS